MNDLNSCRRLLFLVLYSLATLIPAGCNVNQNLPSPSATAAPLPTLEAAPTFEKYFEGFAAAFVLYDQGQDRYVRYNEGQCARQFIPASTFKIMNALIGLETGVIPDENHVIQWDGTQYDIPSWNQDHTLKTATQYSVVWYYRELAHRAGQEKIQHYIDAVGYGNRDISTPFDLFWLNGALRISADEQVQFLKRLYQEDLPFSPRSMEIVKKILILEQTDTYQLSGKTGSGQMDGFNIGWFVGFLEDEGNAYFFAANIHSASSEATGSRAKEIVLRILQDFELLP